MHPSRRGDVLAGARTRTGPIRGQLGARPCYASSSPGRNRPRRNATSVRRGSGLAARLHTLGLEEAARQGYETIRLYTPHGAARARAFYEREGWALVPPAFSEPLLGLDLVEYRRGL